MKTLIVLVVAAVLAIAGPSIFHAYIHPRDAAGLLAAACEANPHRKVFISTKSEDSSGILGCDTAKRVRMAEVERMQVRIYESQPVVLLFGRSVSCLYLREPPRGEKTIECNASVDGP